MPAENSLHNFSIVDKFFELNDDLEGMLAVQRRVLFKFLRTKPTLSVEEIDNSWATTDLPADLAVPSRLIPEYLWAGKP